jgi:hypothetical protein
MTSIIQDEIDQALKEHEGEIKGTFVLADKTNSLNNKYYMIRQARRMRADGLLDITPSNGGRGRMTIYRCPYSRCAHCSHLTCPRRHPRARRRTR